MAPVPRYAQLLGAAAYAVIFGLVHTIFVMVILSLFFELDLSNANFATAALFTLLGTISFAGIDRRLHPAARLRRARGADGVRHPVGAAAGERGLLQRGDPAAMDADDQRSPATYVLDGVREGLINGKGIDSLLHDVWLLLMVAIPAGTWLVGRSVRKRTGKLKRVG